MLSTSVYTPSSSILNVESVHLQPPNMSNDDISQLAIIETQVVAWIPHICLSICWGFFVVNDGLHVDLVKPQVLQCIIYKYE
jgi:hypothetical protein